MSGSGRLYYHSFLIPKFPAIMEFKVQGHSGHWGINPPQRQHPLFLAKLPLNQQTVQAPYFRQFPLYIDFSRPP